MTDDKTRLEQDIIDIYFTLKERNIPFIQYLSVKVCLSCQAEITSRLADSRSIPSIYSRTNILQMYMGMTIHTVDSKDCLGCK